jgi:glutaredoxin
MKGYILGYILIGCPYSMMADEILKKNSNNKLIYVNHNEKEIYKKSNDMLTFPQIFYIKDTIQYKIGGYHELSILLDKKKLENIKELHKYICNDISYRIFLQIILYLNK